MITKKYLVLRRNGPRDNTDYNFSGKMKLDGIKKNV